MPFSAQSTVAFSVVVINGVMTPPDPIQTMSGRGTHAEIDFIEEAKGLDLLMGSIQGANIEITINISKSPCFTCREDLEDFLESLTQREATVSFTLRIANLYCGDGGGKDEIIEDLASWLYHLKREKIVHTLVIQPIEVVTEMPDYRPRPFDNAVWLKIQKDRNTRDTAIVDIVTGIVTTVDKRAIAQTPVNTRPLFTTLTEVKETLDPAKRKREFIESSCATSNVYVAVAQVQINAVNTVGRSKHKVLKPFEKHGEGCCRTIPDIKTEINQFVKPESWSTQSSTIALAVTHFPCNHCLVRITNEITLILRVANIPYDRNNVIEWLFDLGIKVELYALEVAEKLGQVNCKQHATQEEQRQWRLATEQRPTLDEEVVKKVTWINRNLSVRKLPKQLDQLQITQQ